MQCAPQYHLFHALLYFVRLRPVLFIACAALVYAWTVIGCGWLMLPALIVSIAGLVRGNEARWPKFLPVCVFGVAALAFRMQNGLMRFAPPQVVVAGVVACMCALLFSGKRGIKIAGGALCCITVATLF